MPPPLTKQDLESFLNERDTRMKEVITEVFRKQMASAIEPLRQTIQEVKNEVEQCKKDGEMQKYELEPMIANETRQQSEKEQQLFITGVKTKAEVTDLIKDILGVDPDIRFIKMLDRRQNANAPNGGPGGSDAADASAAAATANAKNCLIGLKWSQAKEILRKKANHMKDNQNLKNIGIRQSLTPLQVRLMDHLRQEMNLKKEQAPPPEGMQYAIRNGMVKLLPARTKKLGEVGFVLWNIQGCIAHKKHKLSFMSQLATRNTILAINKTFLMRRLVIMK